MTSPASEVPGVARRTAARDFADCARDWWRLTRAGALRAPREHVGRIATFADGSRSLIFRETARVDPPAAEPVLLVIAFRLAMLGSSGPLHAAFRHECVLHTPLFAGFPGFRSKLWLDDVHTGVYRGLYEWGDRELADAYAHRMVALLAPFSTKGTARFHLVPSLPRERFLADPGATPGGDEDAWWRLAEPLPRTDGRGANYGPETRVPSGWNAVRMRRS